MSECDHETIHDAVHETKIYRGEGELMTTRQELIDCCLTFPAAYEDYPFDEVADENATTVMRHKANKKSFALIMRHHGKLYLNLKCEPLEADFLRQAFEGIIPGYHINKELYAGFGGLI
jgi:predicted DNA-binding protein (MmcQ/YjbR family)